MATRTKSSRGSNENVNVDLTKLSYVHGADGTIKSVIVPIDVWKEVSSRLETDYLLGNPVMRARLLEAIASTERIPYDEVLRAVGLRPDKVH